MGRLEELRKWGVERCNKVGEYAKQQHKNIVKLYNKLDGYAQAQRKTLLTQYNKLKKYVQAEHEAIVKQRNRLEEQRKREAAAAEERRKREVAAAEERRKREAAAAEDQRKREAEQRSRREAQRRRQVAALHARFSEVTEPYLEKLAARRNLVLAKDAYGFTSDLQRQSWDQELQGFLKNAVYSELSRDQLFLLGMSSRDLLTREIDRWENLSNGPIINTAHPLGYEQSCCEILKAAGWDASLTKESGGDPGADIFADKAANRIVVQCKLHTAPVGNKSVHEVRTAKNFYTAGYAVVVSASGFTFAAEKLAAASGVKLIHHDQLRNIDGIIGLQNG